MMKVTEDVSTYLNLVVWFKFEISKLMTYAAVITGFLFLISLLNIPFANIKKVPQ